MAVPQHPFLRLSAAWDRPIVPVEGGTAALLVHISATQPPQPLAERPPMDIAFVIDRSGSMSGEPLELVKQAVSAALDTLDERDRVSLISFDENVRVWHDLGVLTPRQKAMTRAMISTIRPGGATNLAGGWFAGRNQLQEHPFGATMRARRVIVLTDGQANAGITDAGELSRYASMFRQQGIATTTIGAGHYYDEFLLSALAEAGGGNHYFVEHPSQFASVFARETTGLAQIVSLAPQLVLTLQPGVSGNLLNVFPARIEGYDLKIDLRDLVANDDLVLILEVTVPPGGEDSVIALVGQMRLQDGTVIPVEIPSLKRRPIGEVVAYPPDPEVVRKHAVERTVRARREAMRLDHEGDVMASRKLLRDSQALLQAAPASPETLELHEDISVLASQQVPFSESTRKRVVHDGHDRSRGRSTR